jgi:hypothetical protein
VKIDKKYGFSFKDIPQPAVKTNDSKITYFSDCHYFFFIYSLLPELV